MEEAEALVVRTIARAIEVENRDDETGLVRLPSDARRRLDVLRRHLRLPKNGHQPESGNVESHRDHVRGEGDIEPIW